MVSNLFFERVELIEKVLYAKSLKKPIILVIKQDTNNLIRDVFKNTDVIGEIEFKSAKSEKDQDKIKKDIKQLIKLFKKKYRKREI